jgi:hypothetical protein
LLLELLVKRWGGRSEMWDWRRGGAGAALYEGTGGVIAGKDGMEVPLLMEEVFWIAKSGLLRVTI